jgi:hypothetical protein
MKGNNIIPSTKCNFYNIGMNLRLGWIQCCVLLTHYNPLKDSSRASAQSADSGEIVLELSGGCRNDGQYSFTTRETPQKT